MVTENITWHTQDGEVSGIVYSGQILRGTLFCHFGLCLLPSLQCLQSSPLENLCGLGNV